MKTTFRLLRKMTIFIIGSAFLLAGIIMLVTPGPGWGTIIFGLFILSIEFKWAERHLQKTHKKLKQINAKIKNKTRSNR